MVPAAPAPCCSSSCPRALWQGLSQSTPPCDIVVYRKGAVLKSSTTQVALQHLCHTKGLSRHAGGVSEHAMGGLQQVRAGDPQLSQATPRVSITPALRSVIPFDPLELPHEDIEALIEQ